MEEERLTLETDQDQQDQVALPGLSNHTGTNPHTLGTSDKSNQQPWGASPRQPLPQPAFSPRLDSREPFPL